MNKTKLLKNVVLIPIDEIIPYHNNPKEHPEEQIDKIASSIKNYGFTVPLIIDGENEIIAGHGRYYAAKKLNLRELPCIKRDDLTDAQAKALRLADNKIAESDWNFEQLAVEFEELAFDDIDMDLTGFEQDEINEILDRSGSEEVEEDNFDVGEALSESEENPLTKDGDIILMGRHRLVCGDGIDKNTYEKLFEEDELADLIVTDPPYNVNYGDKANMLNEYLEGDRNTDHIENDNMDDKEFKAFLYASYKNMFDYLKEGGGIYVFHADTEGKNFRTEFERVGFKLAQVLIWVKNTLVLGRQDYQWKHEPILYGWKPGAGHYWNGGRKQTTVLQEAPGVVVNEVEDGYEIIFDMGVNSVIIKVPDYELIDASDDCIKTTWFFDKPRVNDLHPTMKPVVTLGRMIKNSSRKNENVFDPFAGSGSTLIAAEQAGRVCKLIEMSPKFCDVIMKRYIELKNNSSDVYVVRNGKRIAYDELR